MKHRFAFTPPPLRQLLAPVLLACGALVAQAQPAATPAPLDEYSEVGLLLRAGKLIEAQTRANQYLASKPRDPQMRFIKGVIQRELGKTADAIATFTKLTEDYPELPEPYNNLAVLYAGQGQFEKSRAALETAIRTNPSYATAYENLGDVYARLASQAYNKALQLEGNNTNAAPKLALIHELFNPGAKGQRPVASTSAAQVASGASTTATPDAATSRPSPGLPGSAAASASTSQPQPARSAPVSPQPSAGAPTPPASSVAPGAVAQPGTAASVGAPVTEGAVREVEAAVRAWAKAWARKDVSGYLSAYGKDFDPPGKASRSAWEDERRKRIVGKSNISVQLENLSVTVSDGKATAKFRQDYRADGMAVSSRKTLELTNKDGRWQIVRESIGN